MKLVNKDLHLSFSTSTIIFQCSKKFKKMMLGHHPHLKQCLKINVYFIKS